MYKIGDFSLITRISIKMLRHYDEIGLFKPAYTDPFTSYRYYMLDQLPRLNRLMALKSMGFSLDQVGEILDHSFSRDELQSLATQKQTDLTRELEALNEKIKHLQYWMRRIDMENLMPEYEIVVKPFTDVLPTLPPLTETPQSMPLPTFKAQIPQDVVLSPDQVRMPRGLACVVHHGSAETLVQAYLALDKWIQEQDYHLVGTPREITLHENTDHPEQSVFEVQIPFA